MMTSDQTRHTARRDPERSGGWRVSWLPGRVLTRDQAVTAMILAGETAATGDDPGSAAFAPAREHANQPGLSLLDAAELIGEDEENGR